MNDINEKIICILGIVLKIDNKLIDVNTSMDTIKEWDSLKHMNLILALEEEFMISIPDEDVANLTSFKIISLVINELLKT